MERKGVQLSQNEVETDVGEDEVTEERELVIFVVGPPNSNSQQANEVSIEKRLMMQRSSYFRQLVSNLD